LYYFLPALLAGSYFAVSETRGVAERIKICHWDPSVERAVKTWTTRAVLRAMPCHAARWSSGWRKKRSSCTSQCFRNENKNSKEHQLMVVNYSRIFAFRAESWNLTPTNKRWISVCVCVCVYIYIHTHILTCTHTYTHIHTYIHTYIHKHTHTYTHTHIHTYIYTYIRTPYTHIYIHTYVHTYTCTYTHIYIARTHTPHVNIPSVTPHRTVLAFIIEPSQWMLYREATGVHCVKYTKDINTMCGLNTDLLV
jgi:hypothetical protein